MRVAILMFSSRMDQKMDVGNYFIKWQDNYSVGHSVLDNQHKYLLKIINDLYGSMISKSRDDDFIKLVKELTKYTNVHFAFEENILEKIEFPGIKDHLSYHEEMKKKVSFLETKMTTLEREWRFELLIFLKNWWLAHVLKQDMKYCSLVKDWTCRDG